MKRISILSNGLVKILRCVKITYVFIIIIYYNTLHLDNSDIFLFMSYMAIVYNFRTPCFRVSLYY